MVETASRYGGQLTPDSLRQSTATVKERNVAYTTSESLQSEERCA